MLLQDCRCYRNIIGEVNISGFSENEDLRKKKYDKRSLVLPTTLSSALE